VPATTGVPVSPFAPRQVPRGDQYLDGSTLTHDPDRAASPFYLTGAVRFGRIGKAGPNG